MARSQVKQDRETTRLMEAIHAEIEARGLAAGLI
jgi:hypothetical protein